MSKQTNSKTYKATVTSEAFSAHEVSAKQAPATPEEIAAVAEGIGEILSVEYTASDGKQYRRTMTFEVVGETLVGSLDVVSVMTGKPVMTFRPDDGSTINRHFESISQFRKTLRRVDAALAARPVEAVEAVEAAVIKGASAVSMQDVVANLKDEIETVISDLTEIDAERGLAMDARYSEEVEASTDCVRLREIADLVQDEFLKAAFTEEEEEGVA